MDASALYDVVYSCTCFPNPPPPPPYSEHVDHCGSLSQDRAAAIGLYTDDAEPYTYTTERVRRFLLYCLVVDYKLTSKLQYKLLKDDWFYFTRLSALCYSVHRKRYPRAMYPLLDWPEDCYNADVETELLRPAQRLGVPRDATVFMLHLFVRCTRVLGRHNRSGLSEIRHYYSLHILARRLALGRDVLINALVPEHDAYTRDLLMQRNQELRLRWFEHLTGPGDYRLNPRACRYERDIEPYLFEKVHGHRDCEYSNGMLDYLWVSLLRTVFQDRDETETGGKRGLFRRWVTWRQEAMFGSPPWLERDDRFEQGLEERLLSSGRTDCRLRILKSERKRSGAAAVGANRLSAH